MKKKKRWIPIVVILALLAIVGFFIARHFLLGQGMPGLDDGDIFIDDGSYTPVVSRFNGIIEPQETWDIQKDPERKIGWQIVEVGQEVHEGDWLFAYDLSDMETQIAQKQLELESIQNDITGYANQIADLTKQRSQAASELQLTYTLQIQEVQASQRQSELNLRSKQIEIDNLNRTRDNALVVSKMDGVVRQITPNPQDANAAYMTILATGNYRVKCTVDEMNIGMLSEGMTVTVHSRVDKDRTWKGTITKIDTENTVSNNNNNMYYEGSSELQASKYHFYVDLETADDLLLGQHVYVEPDMDAFYGGMDEGMMDEEGMMGEDGMAEEDGMADEAGMMTDDAAPAGDGEDAAPAEQ